MSAGDVSIHPNVRRLSASATVAINERSNALIATGRNVYKLGLGQSPFPVPEVVVQALRDHAAEKDYLPVKGLRALRDAVAAYHTRAQQIAARGDDVLIGPGSKELMFLLQLVHDGELVIPAPAWVSYAPQAQLIGRKVHWLHTRYEDGWRLVPSQLDAHCRAHTAPQLLILNYPSNPTGNSYVTDELAAIARVARRHRVVVLSDEIYGELHHRGEHDSIARAYPEGTIVSSGLSKWCGAGGWRLGTFSFPPELSVLRDALATAASETFTSTSAPIQHAAVRAFEGGADIDRYLHDSRGVLAALGSWCATRLRAAGALLDDPVGGFYLFPDFSALAPRLAARGIEESEALSERLLEETGVAVLPGSCFGHRGLTLRLAYVDFDGAQALAAVKASAIDDAWLQAHCPRVLAAIERMCGFLEA